MKISKISFNGYREEVSKNAKSDVSDAKKQLREIKDASINQGNSFTVFA